METVEENLGTIEATQALMTAQIELLPIRVRVRLDCSARDD